MTFAEWLNSTFSSFDGSILRAMYEAELAFPWLAKLARFISYLCDKGIVVIVATLILLVFRKRRKQGIIIAVALIIQAILINLVLKNMICRDRMFWDETSEYYKMWLNAGGTYHSSYSFPSGHTANATAFGVGIFLSFNKKYSWIGLLFPLVMAWSRVALFVHYPTDTIAALILISLTTIGAYFLSLQLFKVKFINKLVEGDTLF